MSTRFAHTEGEEPQGQHGAHLGVPIIPFGAKKTPGLCSQALDCGLSLRSSPRSLQSRCFSLALLHGTLQRGRGHHLPAGCILQHVSPLPLRILGPKLHL